MASRGEDIIDGFAQGVAWGIPELFGFKPPMSAQTSMDKAPVASMIGSMLSGVVVPYGSFYKASVKIPRYAKMVERAGKIAGENAPFARGAAREMARFAPLEIARVGIGVPFGDVGLGEAITDSAFNLALEGVGGGLAEKLAKAGARKLRGTELLGETAAVDPPQLTLRAADDAIASGKIPPEKMPEYAAVMKKLGIAARTEKPVGKREFIGNLVSGQDRGAFLDLMSDARGRWTTHRFIKNGKGEGGGGRLFNTDEDWQNLLGAAGIDALKMDRFAVTPRFVQFTKKGAAEAAARLKKTGASDIGNGWYKLDETDDGFHVLIKKIRPTNRAKLVKAGEKVPEFNRHGGFFVTVTDQPDWFRVNQATRLNRTIEENLWVRRNYKILGGEGGKLGQRAIEQYHMLPFRTMQLIRQTGTKFNTIADMAGLKAGSRTIKDNKQIKAAADYVKRIAYPTRFQFKNSPRAQLIFQMAEDFKKDAKLMAQELMYGKIVPPKGGPVGPSLISRLNAVAEGKGFAGNGYMDAFNALPEDSVQKLQELANEGAFSSERIMHLKAEGRLDDAEEMFLRKAEDARQELLLESNRNDLKFGGMKFPEYSFSFMTKSDKILSKAQLRASLEDRAFKWTDTLSNSIIDNVFTGEMRLVDIEDSVTGKILKERINDLKGELRPVAAFVNKTLEPLLGRDGASKIAEWTNTAMFDLTLAGVNTAYLVMNPIGVFTNVVPRAMMVINGRGLGVGNDMHYWPVPGVGTVGIFDGLKAMKQTLVDIRRPDYITSQMFDRAVMDQKLLPDIVAEGVGTEAPTKRNIAQLWRDGNYVQAMRLGWRLPAARSEQYSRLIAFTTAVRMARSAGLTNQDDIYRVAVKILDDSMYGYRQADKPAWMTGPVGGPLGLFKNWSMNFLGDTLEYSGAAVRGNWRPLLWQQASIMAIAGVKGSPIGLMAAGFNEMFSDNDLVQNMYDMAGEEAGGAMAFGLPMFLGFSLAPQGSAPGANPARDIQSVYEPVAYDRIKALFLAGGEAWNRYRVTGDHPAESPEIRRLMAEAVAPRTVMRLIQQFMVDDAIASSKTGYPLIKNPSLAQRVWYTMGVSTEDMQKRTHIADVLYRDKARRTALTAGYGEALKDAIEAQDWQGYQRLLKRATSDGLDPNSVAKSAASRLKQGDLDQIDRASNPKYAAELKRAFGVSP